MMTKRAYRMRLAKVKQLVTLIGLKATSRWRPRVIEWKARPYLRRPTPQIGP